MAGQQAGAIDETSRPVAWIIGASSGIGRALALKLAAQGWRVAVSARTAAALDSLAAESLAAGQPGRIDCFPLDITNRAQVLAEAAVIERVVGPISLAVLAAGTYARDSVAEVTAERLRPLIELNLIGAVNGLEAVTGPMMARGRGQIAVVASMAGYTGLPGAAAYGATKAGLITLCEALYPELERAGVRLQVINPGFVATPLTARNDFPMPFLVTVEQAAEAIIKGLGRRCFEIAFPWPMRCLMALLRALPPGLRFRLTRRMLRPAAPLAVSRPESGEAG